MKALKGSKTHDNLKAAFAGESQANRRYLYFAAKADVEGQNDVAAVFRSTAEGETGHAHGHLEYMEPCGDPVHFQGGRGVHQVEQGGEGGAQVHAPPAAVADVEDALELPLDRRPVVELRVLPVERVARRRL